MPGATTARLVVCAFEMPMKLFMMPQTVPNKPTKGAVAPMVASTPVPRRMRRPSLASMRSRRDAIRSLMPSLSVEPADSLSSVTAASRNRLTSPRGLRGRSTPSDVERTPARILTAAPTRRLASTISMVLASHTVR